MATKELPQDPTPIAVDEVITGSSSAVPASVQTEATIAQQSMLNVMRDKFATEKRVPVKVHNDGPVQVQINGYSFLIREGVKVEVPESVRDILDEAGYI